jgi:hypothetical protein
MRKLSAVVFSLILALVLIQPLLAQTRSEIEVTRADIQADRKTIVADNLPLTDAQAAAFWPIYQEYRGEMGKLGDRMVKLITDYAKSYDSLTDEQATALMAEYIAIQKDAVKVKDKYVSRFNKVIPAKSVMRFYQIENKLDTIIQLGVVAEVPLVK